MTRVPNYRTAAACATVALLTAGLLGGCDSTGAPQRATSSSKNSQAGGRVNPQAQRVLTTRLLEAALPDQHSVPVDLQARDRPRARDNGDTVHCVDEGWPDEWCGEALSVGSSIFAAMADQELVFRYISFPDSTTAARFFIGEGSPDEVGEDPPGDEIDGFDIDASSDVPPILPGKGINVRQGNVIAKIEYRFDSTADIPSDRLQTLATMVVQRIQQAQAGKPPTASAR
ncbi:hypothetical protein [Streptomyces sp. NBC_00467]|uniref:hypothetical protein n=1 Tax=Streptomyces sp. NBC_00467 TaxID=2975752 RepID=UPI002E17C9B9